MGGRAEPTSSRIVLRALAGGAAPVALGRCSTSPPREEIEAQAATYDPALDCTDATGLWPAERKTREDNQYRDRSTEPREFCFRCENFQPPVAPGRCATCRTVKGPIHPLGWCTAWTERRT
jgi:hypothetical protein